MMAAIEALARKFGGSGKNNEAPHSALGFDFAVFLSWDWLGMAAKDADWHGPFRCLELGQS
jgi:hypothetical protein